MRVVLVNQKQIKRLKYMIEKIVVFHAGIRSKISPWRYYQPKEPKYMEKENIMKL